MWRLAKKGIKSAFGSWATSLNTLATEMNFNCFSSPPSVVYGPMSNVAFKSKPGQNFRFLVGSGIEKWRYLKTGRTLEQAFFKLEVGANSAAEALMINPQAYEWSFPPLEPEQ
eukprot:1159840-Pelagomonas_calceolata.AAC.1